MCSFMRNIARAGFFAADDARNAVYVDSSLVSETQPLSFVVNNCSFGWVRNTRHAEHFT